MKTHLQVLHWMFFSKLRRLLKPKPEGADYWSSKERGKTGWDAELRIYGLEDRKMVMTNPGGEMVTM